MKPLEPNENLVLIGMPCVGKSTTGLLLAEALSRPFIDTDVLIQSNEGRRLQELLDEKGRENFIEMEEGYIMSLQCRGHVIATGGSVIYSPIAMEHLKRIGRLILLDLPLAAWTLRLEDFADRGVVKEREQSLASLYGERMPLYQCYADATIDCTGFNHAAVVSAALAIIGA